MARQPQPEAVGGAALFRRPAAGPELTLPAVERLAEAAAAESAAALGPDRQRAVAAAAGRVLVLAPVGRDAALAADALSAAGISVLAVASAPELLDAVSEEVGRVGA